MTKTLFAEKGERKSSFDIPEYVKVTATKIDEIEAGKSNVYKDKDGNTYIVKYNNWKRREEFVKIG